MDKAIFDNLLDDFSKLLICHSPFLCPTFKGWKFEKIVTESRYCPLRGDFCVAKIEYRKASIRLFFQIFT